MELIFSEICPILTCMRTDSSIKAVFKLNKRQRSSVLFLPVEFLLGFSQIEGHVDQGPLTAIDHVLKPRGKLIVYHQALSNIMSREEGALLVGNAVVIKISANTDSQPAFDLTSAIPQVAAAAIKIRLVPLVLVQVRWFSRSVGNGMLPPGKSQTAQRGLCRSGNVHLYEVV